MQEDYDITLEIGLRLTSAELTCTDTKRCDSNTAVHTQAMPIVIRHCQCIALGFEY